jgi:putative transposase
VPKPAILGGWLKRRSRQGSARSPGKRPTTTPWPGSFNGLDKAELTHKDGPWAGLGDVEFAILEYVDWFNHWRLHTELGMRPRAEFEAEYPHGEQAQMAASQ